MAIAVHPSKNIIATGEIGPKPQICVWSADDMQLITSFNSPLKKGIAHLAFSPSGRYLAASAMDDEHNVAVYEWKRKSDKKGSGPLFAAGKGTRANILSLCFDP